MLPLPSLTLSRTAELRLVELQGTLVSVLRALLQHLRRALAELEPRQAQVFCLACLEEVGYAEIGQQLGITVNHVGVLLSRARGELRERLRAHAPGGTAKERKVQP